jgi:hypothetical protein
MIWLLYLYVTIGLLMVTVGAFEFARRPIPQQLPFFVALILFFGWPVALPVGIVQAYKEIREQREEDEDG